MSVRLHVHIHGKETPINDAGKLTPKWHIEMHILLCYLLVYSRKHTRIHIVGERARFGMSRWHAYFSLFACTYIDANIHVYMA
jgi:hypothetical protein